MKKSRTYSIEDNIYESFDKLATKLNINKSSFLEEKIIEFIEKNEHVLKDKFEEDWLILITTMGITDPNHAEKLIKYAKKSIEMSNMRMAFQPSYVNYTPYELKILSKIDPNKFYIVEAPITKEGHVGDIQFNFSEEIEVPIDSELKDINEKCFSIIVDRMIDILNSKTEKIGVYSLINDVALDIDFMKGNIRNQRKDKDVTYLKHKVDIKIISRLIF